MLGLSATPKRKDGLMKVAEFYIGGIVYSVKNAGKNVLVCWEHKVIVDLVNEIIKQVYNDKCEFKTHSWGDKIQSTK